MPAVLPQLLWHNPIETTLMYYVDLEADAMAARL